MKLIGTNFEISINDYANNWYITVPDASCRYVVELGRKTVSHSNKKYIYMACSNPINTPNDHVLLQDFPKKIHFFNIKTGEIFEKNISYYNNKSIDKLYNFYKGIKKEGLLKNPSS